MAQDTASTPARLTPRQEALALAVALGATRRAWATEHGIPYATVKKWGQAPGFSSLVKELQAELISGAIGLLVDDLARSISTLKQIRDAPASGARARVSACRVLIDRMIRLKEFADFEARLAAVEQRVLARPRADGDGDGPRLEIPDVDERFEHDAGVTTDGA